MTQQHSNYRQAKCISAAITRSRQQYFVNPDPLAPDKPIEIHFDQCPVCNTRCKSYFSVPLYGPAEFFCESGKHANDAEEALSQFGIKPSSPKLILPLAYSEFRRQHAGKHRDVLIHGLLREGETYNVVAASKMHKTLIALQMMLSLASGKPFLGKFETEPPEGMILYLDYELWQDSICRRVDKQMELMGLNAAYGNCFQIHSMRGASYMTIQQVCDAIENEEPGTYSLVIVDALYRAIGRDFAENSNDDIKDVYNRLDRCAAKQRCSFVVINHTSKGDQTKKATADIGAGAGAQSRAADAHMALVPHAKNNHAVVKTIVRDFPPIDDFVIRCDWPLWVLAEDEVAEESERCWADVVLLLEPGEEARQTVFADQVTGALGVAKRTATALVNAAIEAGHLTQSKKDRKNYVSVTQETFDEAKDFINERSAA